MSDNEIKWIVVHKLGSRITKAKLLRDKEVYNKLSNKLITNDVTVMCDYLQRLGFNIYTRKPRTKTITTKTNSKNIIKSTKSDREFENYISYRADNKKAIMKDYYDSKYRDKKKLFE